jgi:cytosine/adenosine deaminase-related metal-dependent hydrolase
MRAARVNVSLSTDATSIAPPNMFEMMRLTWNLGVPWKGTENEGENPVGVHEVIEMATINGAKALGLGEMTGSLTEGKRADIILIRAKDINVAPVGNIETAVVQTATPANVDTVLVDGTILKRSGRLLAYDMPGIIDQAEKSASGIRNRAGDLLKF